MNRAIVAACTLLAGIAVWTGVRLADSPSAHPHPRDLQEPGFKGSSASTGISAKPIESEASAPTINAPETSDALRGATAMSSASPPAPSPPTGAEMIERWLSTTEATAGAVTVLQHWSSLKPEEQLPALGRILNMVPDDRYEEVQRVLADPKTTREAAEVIFRDAVNRSSEVKLHTMLALISKPQHPLASTAHEALVNDLGIDDGANQGAWIAHVQEHLRGLLQR